MRLRLRRILVSIVAVSTLSLALINLRFWITHTQDDIVLGKTISGSKLVVGSWPATTGKSNETEHSSSSGIEGSTAAAKSKAQLLLEDVSIRPWFMINGQQMPAPVKVNPDTGEREAKLWPDEQDNDRIVSQLMYIPPADHLFKEDENLLTNVTYFMLNGSEVAMKSTEKPKEKLKLILLNNGMHGFYGVHPGRNNFLADKCPVDTCTITTDRNRADVADMILFTGHYLPTNYRPLDQVWMIYMLECPYHTAQFPQRHLFNWTATYRSDSDIVTPYGKFVPYDVLSTYNTEYNNTVSQRELTDVPTREFRKNYAKGKTKQVAWFVSNCGARNRRIQYARELAKYIQVDIYGTCGTHRCPRSESKRCFGMLDKDYRFYLAFENSNCIDYITEKYFVNGLGHDIIPIVMGARKEDYLKASPPNSFIHVDDFKSAKELAEYLIRLSEDENAYNDFLRWKGTGEFINTFFWCRVCSMLHDREVTQRSKSYENFDRWWRGPGVCISGSWSEELKKNELKRSKLLKSAG